MFPPLLRSSRCEFDSFSATFVEGIPRVFVVGVNAAAVALSTSSGGTFDNVPLCAITEAPTLNILSIFFGPSAVTVSRNGLLAPTALRDKAWQWFHSDR